MATGDAKLTNFLQFKKYFFCKISKILKTKDHNSSVSGYNLTSATT